MPLEAGFGFFLCEQELLCVGQSAIWHSTVQ